MFAFTVLTRCLMQKPPPQGPITDEKIAELRLKKKNKKAAAAAPPPSSNKKRRRNKKTKRVRIRERRWVTRLRTVPRVLDGEWSGQLNARHLQSYTWESEEARAFEVGDDGWEAARGHSEELEEPTVEEQYEVETDVETEVEVTDDEEEEGEGRGGKRMKMDDDDDGGAAGFFVAPLAFRPFVAC
ncbi:uncharacterized protein PAC_01656 [Phialocephala subalpina]|uniref:Uncharacterized protein n=1 Tax=Phialocephala subalpina TaxID=576137 RepID=A0A1L7WG91_9HELO|nr:uncharacterized protein PAC_01656 [Phialocephala subalpina]